MFQFPLLAALAIGAMLFLTLQPLVGDVPGRKGEIRISEGEFSRDPALHAGTNALLHLPEGAPIPLREVRGIAVDRHENGVDITLVTERGEQVFRTPASRAETDAFLTRVAAGRLLPPALQQKAAVPVGFVACVTVLVTPMALWALLLSRNVARFVPSFSGVMLMAFAGAMIGSGVPLAIAYTRRRITLGIDGFRSENGRLSIFTTKLPLGGFALERDEIVSERLHLVRPQTSQPSIFSPMFGTPETVAPSRWSPPGEAPDRRTPFFRRRAKRLASVEFRSVAERDRFVARFAELELFAATREKEVLHALACDAGNSDAAKSRADWRARIARLAAGAQGGYRDVALDSGTVVRALVAEDPSVRIAAARILASTPETRVRIHEAALATTDPEVRSALEALATASDDESRDAIVERWAGTRRMH